MSFPNDLTLSPPPEHTTPATRARKPLLKALDCTVEYLDGEGGQCHYDRLGPAYHSFTFTRGEEKRPLSHLWSIERIANVPEAIATKCQDLAQAAFWRAVEQERKDWFARATLKADSSRTVDPRSFRMNTFRARSLGGKYSLCVPVGTALVPASPTYDTLREACNAWENNHRHLVVGCCSRLDRNWQLPRLNPLVKQGHPRRGDTIGGTSASSVENEVTA